MKRLESMLQTLRNKGWIITETSAKTLVEYHCEKVNTAMDIVFVDNKEHAVKKNSDAIVSAIKVKDVKEIKKSAISRKEDMIQDLLTLTSNRIDIIINGSVDKSEEFNNFLKSVGFIMLMKDINEPKHMKCYTRTKTFPTARIDAKTKEQLISYKKSFERYNSDSALYIDGLYDNIIQESVLSDKDIEFLVMYLSIIKNLLEIENEDYGNIYDDEVEVISKLVDMLSKYIE